MFLKLSDIPRSMEDGDNGEGCARGIVYDEVQKDAPELQGTFGEVLARMADAGVLREDLECLLQRVVDLERRLDAVLGDEDADLVDLALCGFSELIPLVHARFLDLFFKRVRASAIAFGPSTTRPA